MTFSHPSSDGQQAMTLAYSDVAAAFQNYLERSVKVSGQTRPFILAAHSQGSVLAYRLLREQIARNSHRQRLIAAYLIGGHITIDMLRQQIPEVPICVAPDQTGCVVAWNSRGPHYTAGPFEMNVREDNLDVLPSPLARRLCVNPLTWKADSARASAALNLGALFLESETSRILPGFASAQCQDGTLVVSEIGRAPRDFMSRLLDHALGAENYHPIEYQLFFVNLRENAQTRVVAYLKQHGQAAAARPIQTP